MTDRRGTADADVNNIRMNFEELKALSDGLSSRTDEDGMVGATLKISPRAFVALVDEVERLRARVAVLEAERMVGR